jgi:hypothetical protein
VMYSHGRNVSQYCSIASVVLLVNADFCEDGGKHEKWRGQYITRTHTKQWLVRKVVMV